MTLTPLETGATLLVLAGVTLLTRALPFWLFRGGRTLPPYIRYLGRVLPPAIMGMLVVYCLRDTVLLSYPYGISEALALLTVFLLYQWKRNTLLCIGVSTVLYMVLVQAVF